MDKLEDKTIRSYSFLWSRKITRESQGTKTHFEAVQSVLDAPIVQGRVGIEIGSGPGRDMAHMANCYPESRFVALDFNRSVFDLKKKLGPLKNVSVVRASALALPFNDETVDFVYSFGVLHHTIDPPKGISEIYRVLKDRGTVVLYLYEDHEGNRIKFYALKAVTWLRKVTLMLPPRLLYFLCGLFSPVVYLLFSVPARLLGRWSQTKHLADAIPFNFGRHPFDLTGDLFDRFGTPIEKRYGREELAGTLEAGGFPEQLLKKIPDTAGWVAWARKGGD